MAIGGHEISYVQLLDLLVPTDSWIKGAPVMLPETLVMCDDAKKTKKYFRYDPKVPEVRMSPSEALRGSQHFMKHMLNAYRERKKATETHPDAGAKMDERAPKPPQQQSKQRPSHHVTMAVVQLKLSSSANQGQDFRLLTESEFVELMMDRPGSKQWAAVHYIQNYIVASAEVLAIPVPYEYEAPYDRSNKKAMIRYHVSDFKADSELKTGNSLEFARKICTVIGYYLSKIHHTVSLRCRAE